MYFKKYMADTYTAEKASSDMFAEEDAFSL